MTKVWEGADVIKGGRSEITLFVSVDSDFLFIGRRLLGETNPSDSVSNPLPRKKAQ
mgnify:CR=1 FL=1